MLKTPQIRILRAIFQMCEIVYMLKVAKFGSSGTKKGLDSQRKIFVNLGVGSKEEV